MATPLYKEYKNRRPCGVVSLCNTLGLLVFEPIQGESSECDFITAWSGPDSYIRGFRRNKVHYTRAGRGYLRKGAFRFYLDGIMRT